MPITENFVLPSREELAVQEINISTPSLRAGAYHFGQYCLEQSKEFMLCKDEEIDPRKCLVEGKAVTSCALEFFQKVKGACREPFENHAYCLENSSREMKLEHCRKSQASFDLCMLEKLGMDRPHVGFYGTPKVCDSKRPLPERFPLANSLKETYDEVPQLPDDFPRENPKSGSRFYFME